ncbi:MAG: AIR synthase related protein [Firmicutes bacterium]|nr:AIR synthase related protein [Bacillota bacterium]
MKTGKISESILRRSVLRQIVNQRQEVVKGAGVGEDCAFLSWKESVRENAESFGLMAVATQTVTLPVKNAAFLAVMAAINNLAASGASPAAITLAITLPAEAEESLLRELMKQAEDCCEGLHVQIAGGDTQVSADVRTPIITATAVGYIQREGAVACLQAAKAFDKNRCMDVVVSKWIAMEGTAVIAEEKEAELSERYPMRLILAAKEQKACLSVETEAAIALKSGVYAMHDARNGGIFGALWELSQKLGVGLNIDLKKIPVRQETIEVCEFYELNPYELLSGGMLIMVTDCGERLVKALEDEGIPATIIGSTNGGNDRIIANQEETRYLEPAKPDEIYKISFN